MPRVRGAIDWPADGGSVEPGSIRVRGWAFDEWGPLEDALLIVGELAPQRPRLGIVRPDVDAVFPSSPYSAASGYECDVDLRVAEPGPVRIELIARTAGRGWEAVASITVDVAAAAEGRAAGRSRAAFTIVQNEATMLPLWLDYYGRYFAPEDLYVLDHASTDGSTEGIDDRCRVIDIHRTRSFDHRWLRSTVESFQRFLLQSYETVLFSETDEFIIADPSHFAGVDDYISSLKRSAARCLGFDVIHARGEPPLNFDQLPLLAQRSYWQASLPHSKRLISKIPLRWSEGFHAEYNAPVDPPDPKLLLAHLHLVDYDWCLNRHLDTASRNWNEDDIRRGDAAHNRISDRDEFDRWFRGCTDDGIPRELIPEHVRGVL